MDFLGIGPLEVLFILVIALIIFGPKDIVKAGQAAGRFLRKLVTSQSWRSVQQTSRDLRNLPHKLIREAGLEDMQKDINNISGFTNPAEELKKISKEIGGEMKDVNTGLSAWTTSGGPASGKPAPVEPAPTETETQNQVTPVPQENTILPPEND